MLRNRLPRHGQFGGKLCCGRRLTFGERLEHVPPVRVGERVEDAPGRVGHA
jgi:hypothetical protein